MSIIRTVIPIFIAVLLLTDTAFAQSIRKQRYDSLLVGDRITPAVSSIMMPRGYTEVILSNSLLSTNRLFKDDRSSLDLDQRYTYFFNTLLVTYGVSSSGRFNVGMDVSYRTGRSDADRNSSPLAVFGNSSDGLIRYERGFTSIGLRAKYVPTRNRNFVIQHSFVIPFSTSSVESAFLGDNRYAFNTQFLYTQFLGSKVFLFGQTDFLVRFKNNLENTDFTSSKSVCHVFDQSPFFSIRSGWNGECLESGF